MTPLTSGNNGGRRSESGPARVDVPTRYFDNIEDAPIEYQRFMSFVDWTRRVGFDGVIDVDAHQFKEEQWPQEQS